MHSASFQKIVLKFKQPSGTSRGILTEKSAWILKLWRNDSPEKIGLGEASIIKTLSPDWSDRYESKLDEVAKHIDHYLDNLDQLSAYPSIQLAIETAQRDLASEAPYAIFDLPKAVNKIPINGLIWMGDKAFMRQQIAAKIKAKFTCIKLKIGAIDFDAELSLLHEIRKDFDANTIEIRVDANGAFSPETALDQLKALSAYDIHSIEQPIRPRQTDTMAMLCQQSPIPIALDEELIGITDITAKKNLLEAIQPHYIILKPSLIGGFKGTDEWIAQAETLGIQWWITSALESNIGLNAIAQYTLTKNNPMPQGLGTGGLYTNNIPPFLDIKAGYLILS